MKKSVWMTLLATGSLLVAGSVAAGNDVVVDSDVTKVTQVLAAEVKAERITVEQAKEMELNRAETYEVTSTVSVDNLGMQISEKLKDSIMPYYSIEFNDPTSDDESYKAVVTEYFGKVE